MNRLSPVVLAVLLTAASTAQTATRPSTLRAAGSSTIDGLFAGTGAVGAGSVVTLTVTGRGGVPSTGVGAVALNVTVTEPTAASYITVWPTGAPRPTASNLNMRANDTVANAVISKVGAGGRVSFFNNGGATHLVVDVVGWFPTGSAYTPLDPARLADSRSGPTIDGLFAGTGAVGAAGSADIRVTGRGGVPASGVGAVALNVTATNPTAASYLTVWPSGVGRPLASNLNTVPGRTVANMVIAKVGTGGQVSVYNNSGAVDVVVDVLGWLPTGSSFTPLVPARVLDTRLGQSLVGGVATNLSLVGVGGLPSSGVGAVVLNVTATAPTAPSYLTVWPAGFDRPLASSLNFVGGQTVANMVVVPTGSNGSISMFSPVSTDVVVDVMGWFPSGGSFTGLTPARLMDTRGTAPSPTPTPVNANPPGILAVTPGTSWQWQIDGQAIDETVLDGVNNPKKMYDVDLFATDAATIGRLHAKNITVVCYVETGSWESYRPDAAAYPASVLGNGLAGYPQERLVDIRRVDVLVPILAARLDLAKTKGCDGIEPDLDDTYNGYNSGFPLTMKNQLDFNRAVADLAHARGMSIGLKNGASAGGKFEAAMAAFADWALNEECNQFGECAGYNAFIAQNKAVFQVEYLGSGTTAAQVCPADNAANFDGILKQSSETLAAKPRIACRFG